MAVILIYIMSVRKLIKTIIALYVCVLFLGTLLGVTYTNMYLKFINTKFIPTDNCYINSSTEFVSFNNDGCLVYGWNMMLIINDTDEIKYVTACTTPSIPKKLKQKCIL
jgi:hypothetical protein